MASTKFNKPVDEEIGALNGQITKLTVDGSSNIEKAILKTASNGALFVDISYRTGTETANSVIQILFNPSYIRLMDKDGNTKIVTAT